MILLLEKDKEAVCFIRLVVDAFDSVSQDYYRLKTTYDTDGIVRERVFCYEFYHRIRCLQEVSGMNQYSVHGEIDKRGHDLFSRDDQRNPDFVFHAPGSMDNNLLVMEVKGKLEDEGVSKDWITLSKFCMHYNYMKGLWVVYNLSYEEIINFLRIQRDRLPKIHTNRIELICKRKANSILERRTFSRLFADVGGIPCQS